MILELKNIHLSFTDTKDSMQVIDGLDLKVKRHQVTALIGGNGSGKTTLLNVISGFQDGYTGDVILNGELITSCTAGKRVHKGIGRLFQGRLLFADLSLLDNLKLGIPDFTGELPFSYLFFKKKPTG